MQVTRSLFCFQFYPWSLLHENELYRGATECLYILLQVFGFESGHYGLSGILKCYLWDSKSQLWNFLLVSTYNLVFINFERWFSIAFPFKHKVYLKKKHVILSCIVIWIMCVGYNSVRYMVTTKILRGGVCYFHQVWPENTFWFDFHWIFNLVIWFLIPALCLLFTNTSILINIKRRNRAWKNKMEDVSNGSKSSNEQRNDNKRASIELNILKTLILVNAAFALCWVWNLSWGIMHTAKLEFARNTVYYDFTVMMMFCNSCVNPVLYSAQYKQFQDQSKTLFCKSCFKEGNASAIATVSTNLSTISH